MGFGKLWVLASYGFLGSLWVVARYGFELALGSEAYGFKRCRFEPAMGSSWLWVERLWVVACLLDWLWVVGDPWGYAFGLRPSAAR